MCAAREIRIEVAEARMHRSSRRSVDWCRCWPTGLTEAARARSPEAALEIRMAVPWVVSKQNVTSTTLANSSARAYRVLLVVDLLHVLLEVLLLQLTNEFVLLNRAKRKKAGLSRTRTRVELRLYRLPIIAVLLFGVGFKLWVGLLVERVLDLFPGWGEPRAFSSTATVRPYRWNSSRFFFCSSSSESCSSSCWRTC